MIKRLMLVAFGAVVGAGFTTWIAWRQGDAQEPVSAGTPTAPFASTVEGPSGFSESTEVPSWTSPEYNQYYSVSEYRTVRVMDDKLVSGLWQRNEYVHTTSFDTTATTSRGRDELYLAGISDVGECVIEKWRMKKVGTLGGGVTKIPVRTEVLRDVSVCPIRQLGADPEQRFILALSGSGAQGRLYSMPIQSNATPVLLYSHNAALPIGDMDFIERYQHVAFGRVWVLFRMPAIANGLLVDDTAIVLVDANNDGLFDDTIVGDSRQLHQSGIIGASTVLESYDSD